MTFYDFADVRLASKDEQIRAWSVEQAIERLEGVDAAFEPIISLAKMIEDFVKTGDVSTIITSAVEEGYTEGRFEVKEAVEAEFPQVRLQRMFIDRGWIATNND